MATDEVEDVSSTLVNSVVHNGGWAFVLAASGFVVFSLWLGLSRYGKITLGRDGEEPEFRTVSWVAMMFSAGIGIGLMFYGVNEPLSHFEVRPPGTSGSVEERTQTAMATTLFHWTLYPWAIFAVVGLAVAYSCFRRGRRQRISAVLTPLIGEKNADGPFGRAVDVLALFAALFGAAASLGLGGLQIGSGLVELGWATSVGMPVPLAVIAVMTTAFAAYVMSSPAMGIQRLSNIIMVLAALLVTFVFVEGPTLTILNLLPASVGSLVGNLPQMAARTNATSGRDVAVWLSSWTVFYWAWWISWAPSLGMFIARISRGRTIRQFVGGVILVPSVVGLIWFAVFGGSALSLERRGADLTGQLTAEGQLFAMLHEFPLASITSLVVLILMSVFFVSGADAASTVMGVLSQTGAADPSRGLVVIWGVMTGAVAAVMLLIGGGGAGALTGLQEMAILLAVPFALVLIGMCVALLRDLRSDPLMLLGERGAEAVEAAVVAGHEKYDGDFAIRIRPSDTPGSTAHRSSDVEDVEQPSPFAPARLPRTRTPSPAEERERTAGQSREGRDE